MAMNTGRLTALAVGDPFRAAWDLDAMAKGAFNVGLRGVHDLSPRRTELPNERFLPTRLRTQDGQVRAFGEQGPEEPEFPGTPYGQDHSVGPHLPHGAKKVYRVQDLADDLHVFLLLDRLPDDFPHDPRTNG